jgi:hypothetical protein
VAGGSVIRHLGKIALRAVRARIWSRNSTAEDRGEFARPRSNELITELRRLSLGYLWAAVLTSSTYADFASDVLSVHADQVLYLDCDLVFDAALANS